MVGLAALLAAIFGFKKAWPSSSESKATSTSSLLGTTRQLTTGQIARGVFWGMWLFWLSQIAVAAIALFVALLLGAVAMKSLGG